MKYWLLRIPPYSIMDSFFFLIEISMYFERQLTKSSQNVNLIEWLSYMGFFWLSK